MRGQFVLHDKSGLLIPDRKLILPNTIPNGGEIAYLKMIARADVADVSAGGNFYIGMADQVPAETDVLADITTEPTSTGGYAREAVTRDATGWPTQTDISGFNYIQTKEVTFAASGADFSRAFSRLFLCNAASGTTGVLFGYSAALSTPLTITDGLSINVVYQLFLN